jgi:hypothetical protein
MAGVSFSSPLSDEGRGLLAHHVARGAGYVFTGSQTPHDPATGRLITSLAEIPDDARHAPFIRDVVY